MGCFAILHACAFWGGGTGMNAADGLGAWAELTPIAMVLVDEKRNVVWRNAAAARFLDDGGIFGIRSGRLEVRSDSQRVQLEQFLLDASDTPALSVFGGRAAGACLAVVQRLPRTAGRQIMVMLRADPSRAWHNGIPVGDVTDLFQLTSTEMQVVRRLMSSQTPVAIAEALSIKLGTVRTHVRNIYAKVGVTSREALVVRCLPFAWLDDL